jgi:hypothetical protein
LLKKSSTFKKQHHNSHNNLIESTVIDSNIKSNIIHSNIVIPTTTMDNNNNNHDMNSKKLNFLLNQQQQERERDNEENNILKTKLIAQSHFNINSLSTEDDTTIRNNKNHHDLDLVQVTWSVSDIRKQFERKTSQSAKQQQVTRGIGGLYGNIQLQTNNYQSLARINKTPTTTNKKKTTLI